MCSLFSRLSRDAVRLAEHIPWSGQKFISDKIPVLMFLHSIHMLLCSGSLTNDDGRRVIAVQPITKQCETAFANLPHH